MKRKALNIILDSVIMFSGIELVKELRHCIKLRLLRKATKVTMEAKSNIDYSRRKLIMDDECCDASQMTTYLGDQ